MNNKFKKVVATGLAATTLGTGAFIAGRQSVKKNIPPNFIEYTIQSGDTLFSISDRFLGSVVYYDDIAHRNGIENPDDIKVGDVIRIYTDMEDEVQTEIGEQTYTIVEGDSLVGICEKMYGERSYALALKLADLNGIPEPNLIKIGQIIIIPPKKELENYGMKK